MRELLVCSHGSLRPLKQMYEVRVFYFLNSKRQMKDIHIGSIIKQKLAESSMTIKEFADNIHCDRTTVYDIFKRKSIDTERLIKISQVLNFDFINEIYLKQPSKISSLQKNAVFIAVEVDKNIIEKIDLPNEFILLIKNSV
jgi:plasmid maintenance system antidote protein VapI